MVGDDSTQPIKFYGPALLENLKDWRSAGDNVKMGGTPAGTIKALRYNTGKFLMSLVPPSLVRYTAAVLTYGAIKYEPNNWRKGFKWTSILDSLERHLAAWKEGEDFDEESGLPHLAHIACNAAFLVEHFDKGLGVDDRTKGAGKTLTFKEPAKK